MGMHEVALSVEKDGSCRIARFVINFDTYLGIVRVCGVGSDVTLVGQEAFVTLLQCLDFSVLFPHFAPRACRKMRK